jgi:hypothetical protein
MRIILTLLLLLPTLAWSNCYVVEDFKGFSAREAFDYVTEKDGFASREFTIKIDGENSSVSPNSISCQQAGNNTLLCLDTTNKGQSTIETWAVYPTKNMVIHTKSINGYGIFNGANMFIGQIKKQCN